jgi:hypothetical protein
MMTPKKVGVARCCFHQSARVDVDFVTKLHFILIDAFNKIQDSASYCCDEK